MHTVIKKYNKTKTNSYNGNVYDSCKEAGHARLLDRMVEKGEIYNYEKQIKIEFWVIQTAFPIIVADPSIDDRKKPGSFFLKSYKVDFKVYHNDNTIEFQEVKGLVDPEWKMKWNLLEACFGYKPNYGLKIIR